MNFQWAKRRESAVTMGTFAVDRIDLKVAC